jgi:tRNA (guanine-N7-)-methyltransferase
MRLRNVPGSRELIAISPDVVHDERTMKGEWKAFFAKRRKNSASGTDDTVSDEENISNKDTSAENVVAEENAAADETIIKETAIKEVALEDATTISTADFHPLHVEIGMGKGTFLLEMARRNPDVDFIGIEKYSSVLLRAIEKHAESPEVKNLVFIRMDAEEIEEVFAPGEIDYIYLNFSDPWPKDRHAKRRLTSDRYLPRYEKLLTKEGGVTFKTDNTDLFDFSLESVKDCGWELLAVTRDLHNSEYAKGNVMTEYETKFSGLGNKICMMRIRPDREKKAL